jgi:LmbE family N-acetylglucosaminyl deacetylase
MCIKSITTIFIGIIFTTMSSAGDNNTISTSIVPPNPSITETHLFFVSVHPDDAPLTFGGMIQNNQGFANQNKFITIYEPFSQTNYTAAGGASVFTNERINYVTALRYNEDANAYNDLFTVWSSYTFWGQLYPELSLRYYLENNNIPPPSVWVDDGEHFTDGTSNTGFHLFGLQSIFYYEVIVEDFLRLLHRSHCAVFLPSAVSNSVYQQHPDHFLVREAAIQAAYTLAQTVSEDNLCQLYFGQDQPYTNGDLPGSLTMINNFRIRLGNTGVQNEVTYPIDKYAKWAMLQNYKSQLDSGYETSLLSRSVETFYLWPKIQYGNVAPDPTCEARSYCNYN